jgi:TetR/AcrR family transcriptional regulator, transcriptional repressor for nem operon
LFAAAPYHAPEDPLQRIMGYLDFRALLIAGSTAEFTCLVGTMAQETFLTNPPIRDACFASISGHAATLEADFAALLSSEDGPSEVTAESLALHTQAVLQGAFILAKAKNDPAIATDSIRHLRRYLTLLFTRSANAKEKTP